MVTTRWLALVAKPEAMSAAVETTRPKIWMYCRCRGKAVKSLHISILSFKETRVERFDVFCFGPVAVAALTVPEAP